MKMHMILAASTALVLLAGCEKSEAPAPGDTATKTEIPAETVPPVDATTAPPVDPEADPATAPHRFASWAGKRSEEHTSELQSLMRISYAVFCLKKKKHSKPHRRSNDHETKDKTRMKK